MRQEAGSVIALLGVFLVALIVGVWEFLSPWVISFTAGYKGGWSQVTWCSVWCAAIVVGVSAVAIIALSASGIHSALQAAASRVAEAPEEPDESGSGA
jgi:hypothetical protein